MTCILANKTWYKSQGIYRINPSHWPGRFSSPRLDMRIEPDRDATIVQAIIPKAI